MFLDFLSSCSHVAFDFILCCMREAWQILIGYLMISGCLVLCYQAYCYYETKKQKKKQQIKALQVLLASALYLTISYSVFATQPQQGKQVLIKGSLSVLLILFWFKYNPINVIRQFQYYSYRFSIILAAFKTLYMLPAEKVNSFIKSYDVFQYDWKNEEDLINALGDDYYKQVKQQLINWYSVLNHLCAIGGLEKMYIPPAMDLSKGLVENQCLFENKMAQDLSNRQHIKCMLDIGCGRGRVAAHMASVTGAHVTGINIDDEQLANAKLFLEESNIENVTVRNFDMNEYPLPFEDGKFDAVYQIQAFSYCKDFKKLFSEIYRVLKPGGKMAFIDWFKLDAYEDDNSDHQKLMESIKPMIGAIGSPRIDEMIRLLENANFNILVSENPSIDGIQAPLIEKADKIFIILGHFIKLLVTCKIFPPHFKVLFDRLSKGGADFTKADRMRLTTSCHYFLVQKN